MRIDTCPRCGTRRPDELQWCRKCGLDFHKAERGDLPGDMRAGAPPVDPPRIKTVQDDWHDNDLPPTPPAPVPATVRVEVGHRWIAGAYGKAMDVGCLAGVGAAVGYAAGLLLAGLLGYASRDLGLFVVLSAVGGWVGARTALWLIAHWPTG